MFRYKSKEQAIIIAALVIMLCLTCLAGATLALFTSNPDDGKIGIVTTAGKINIDIVDAEKNSLVNGTLKFVPDNPGSPILFEPGATFRTQAFYIENNGDISIRFRVYVSNDEQMDMEEFNRGFEVWVGTNPDDPTKGMPITEFSEVLLPHTQDTQPYYLFVHMKESAGNEFNNNNNKNKPVIYSGIGITVFAVQGNADLADFKE